MLTTAQIEARDHFLKNLALAEENSRMILSEGSPQCQITAIATVQAEFLKFVDDLPYFDGSGNLLFEP